MMTKKKIHFITELQEIQRLAVACPSDVELRGSEGDMVVDAKSYIGMYALDFTKPIIVVSDSEEYHAQIRDIGETVE